MADSDGTFIELDARNRASLGKLAGPHRRFLARVEPGGVIVLTPATVVPYGTVEAHRRWTDPTDNIGTGATAGPPSAWLDASDGDGLDAEEPWLAVSEGDR